jgi:hypothetical protein
MMEDEIKEIAEREGWSERTLIGVLIGVLEDVVLDTVAARKEAVLNAIEERAHG